MFSSSSVTSIPFETPPSRELTRSPLEQKEEETYDDFRVSPLDIFVRTEKNIPTDAWEHLEIIRQREWRIVSDARVREKLEKRHLTSYPLRAYPPLLQARIPQTIHNPCVLETFTSPTYIRGLMCHSRGSRSYMEDTAIAGMFTVPIFHEEKTVEYYCLLDGHGGTACASFVTTHFQNVLRDALQHLPRPQHNLASDINLPTCQTQEGYIWNALKLTITKIQEMWTWSALSRRLTHPEQFKTGTTLCATVRIDNDVWCVNIGDSRALAIGNQTYLQLSQDMKFNEEMVRSITKRGGTYGVSPIDDTERLNVNEISMSRAIGDCTLVGLACRPKITRFSLTDDFENCCLIIASDGLWDEFSSDEIAGRCRKEESSVIKDLTLIAANCEAADNVFMVYVPLKAR